MIDYTFCFLHFLIDDERRNAVKALPRNTNKLPWLNLNFATI